MFVHSDQSQQPRRWRASSPAINYTWVSHNYLVFFQIIRDSKLPGLIIVLQEYIPYDMCIDVFYWTKTTLASLKVPFSPVHYLSFFIQLKFFHFVLNKWTLFYCSCYFIFGFPALEKERLDIIIQNGGHVVHIAFHQLT